MNPYIIGMIHINLRHALVSESTWDASLPQSSASHQMYEYPQHINGVTAESTCVRLSEEVRRGSEGSNLLALRCLLVH